MNFDRSVKSRRGTVLILICATFVTVAGVLAFARLRRLDYKLSLLIPEKVYDVEVWQAIEGSEGSGQLETYVPTNDDRQSVMAEQNTSPSFHFSTVMEGDNRLAVWKSENLSGAAVVTYTYRVATSALKFEISPEFRLGYEVPARLDPYLSPTEVIQSDAEEIREFARSLLPQDGKLITFLQNSFDSIRAYPVRPFKGTTSALTAFRLKEASCNGRSRLLAALWRSQGIPTRLIGGIVLTAGTKQTSHQWVEAWVGGHWVPFDATNNHFAEIPGNYLTLYRGDLALFTHTGDMSFRYHFRIESELIPRRELQDRKQVLGLWSVFSEMGIPLDLLKIIIMLPLGAVVVVIFRNVVGIRTFGTFLPALIAAAAGKTGLFWGCLGFVVLILFGAIIRRLLSRLQILHSPQLAIILTGIISGMLLLAILGSRVGVPNLGRVTLFPIAILAITAERFFLMTEEEGPRTAWTIMAFTLFVTFFCYVTMNSLSLEILMLAFPEFLLIVIAVDLWLGRWMGLRITEWVRFRNLANFAQDKKS